MEGMKVPAREPHEGVTFQDVWVMFQEADRRMKETERLLKELGVETDRRLGKLGNRLGDIVEGLMSPQLDKKFEDLGYSFTGAFRNYEIKDHNKQRLEKTGSTRWRWR